MAAELSYSFLLAFFPFLIFLSSLISLLPVDASVLSLLLEEFPRFLPNQTNQEIQDLILHLNTRRGGGLAIWWVGLALWVASIGLNGLAAVLNRAYGSKERRSFLRVRILALGVTLALSALILVAGVLLFFGDEMNRVVAGLAPADSGLAMWTLQFLYTVIRWMLILFLLNLGLQIVYYTLPAIRLPWRFFSPGSVLTTTAWLLGSLVFASYINHFANYQRLYGSLASLIVLMFWFYYSSLCLLLGGEIDSEIFRRKGLERAASA